MLNTLHPHQNTILLKLAGKSGQKYSDLQIREIENDLFNYHLKQLVKTNLVNKKDGLYSLTEKGLDKILLADSKGKVYEGLRASVLIYIIKDDKLIVSQKRIREPYIGDEGAGISGKIKKGELIITAAKRKMLEETGLTGDIRFIGVLRKIRVYPDELVDDGIFHVCICNNPSGKLISNEFGVNEWINFEQALQLEKKLKTSGDKSVEVLNNVLSGNFEQFYFEEQIKIAA